MKKPNDGKSLRRTKKELQAIYAKSRREFSAADLQKFTVIEKGIPLEKVIEDMERIQRTYKPKKTAKRA